MVNNFLFPMDANRDARRRGLDHPYGAGALLVMQRRVKEALAAAERNASHSAAV